MKKFFGLLAVGVALMMSSCTTVRHTATAGPVDNKVISFTVADLNVKKNKVTKTYNWNWNPFKCVSVDLVKENTEAALLQENGADVLVEPEYIIERRGLMRGGSVTVIGFPATYTNFHKMTPEEAEVVKKLGTDCKVKKSGKKRFILF